MAAANVSPDSPVRPVSLGNGGQDAYQHARRTPAGAELELGGGLGAALQLPFPMTILGRPDQLSDQVADAQRPGGSSEGVNQAGACAGGHGAGVGFASGGPRTSPPRAPLPALHVLLSGPGQQLAASRHGTNSSSPQDRPSPPAGAATASPALPLSVQPAKRYDAAGAPAATSPSGLPSAQPTSRRGEIPTALKRNRSRSVRPAGPCGTAALRKRLGRSLTEEEMVCARELELHCALSELVASQAAAISLDDQISDSLLRLLRLSVYHAAFAQVRSRMYVEADAKQLAKQAALAAVRLYRRIYRTHRAGPKAFLDQCERDYYGTHRAGADDNDCPPRDESLCRKAGAVAKKMFYGYVSEYVSPIFRPPMCEYVGQFVAFDAAYHVDSDMASLWRDLWAIRKRAYAAYTAMVHHCRQTGGIVAPAPLHHVNELVIASRKVSTWTPQTSDDVAAKNMSRREYLTQYGGVHTVFTDDCSQYGQPHAAARAAKGGLFGSPTSAAVAASGSDDATPADGEAGAAASPGASPVCTPAPPALTGSQQELVGALEDGSDSDNEGQSDGDEADEAGEAGRVDEAVEPAPPTDAGPASPAAHAAETPGRTDAALADATALGHVSADEDPAAATPTAQALTAATPAAATPSHHSAPTGASPAANAAPTDDDGPASEDDAPADDVADDDVAEAAAAEAVPGSPNMSLTRRKRLMQLAMQGYQRELDRKGGEASKPGEGVAGSINSFGIEKMWDRADERGVGLGPEDVFLEMGMGGGR